MFKKIIAGALVATASLSASAQTDILGTFNFVESLDATQFTSAADVYQFVLTSDTAYTSVAFTLNGAFLNENSSVLTFQDNAALPVFFGTTIPETFSVTPDGTAALAATQIDTDSVFDVAFTVQGTTPVVNVGETTIATLSVDPGTLPTFVVGSATRDGGNVTADIVIPEPASLALIGLGGLAMATRRRRA